MKDRGWAMVDAVADDVPAGRADTGVSVLLARRHRYTGEVSSFRCWSPKPVSLARLVGLSCRRWVVEEDFAAAKGAARLDTGQVTTWTSWHRWSAASLVALIVLAVGAAVERAREGHDSKAELVPLSCFELLRLIRVLVLPPPVRDPAHVLAWSAWRRRHQYKARECHHQWHQYADSAS